MTDEIRGLRRRVYSRKEVAEIVSGEGRRVTVGSRRPFGSAERSIATKGVGVNESPASSTSESLGESTSRHTADVAAGGRSQRVGNADVISGSEPATLVPLRGDTKTDLTRQP